MKFLRSRRSSKKENGYTLVELIIVMVIAAVLITIAVFQMSSWLGKARVEEEIKQMYSDLVNARMRAMNRNRIHFVTMTSAQYQIWEDTNPGPDGNGALETAPGGDTRIQQVGLKDSLVSSSTFTGFSFDGKGLISAASGTIQIQNNNGSYYDCISVSPTRLRLGRMNGANCS